MRSKLTSKQRREANRVQHLVQAPIKQCQAIVLYLSAYVRVFVKPRFKSSRKERSSHNMAITVLSSLAKQLGAKAASVAPHIRPARTKFEQSLFWLHASNPYTV